MTLALIAVAIITAGVAIIGYLDQEAEAAIVGVVICIVFIILAGLSYDCHNEKTIVDLPEKYQQLSHDSAKPDTILAFYDNDTVYIEFKH